MNNIKAVGMVIYTYSIIEEQSEDLLIWLQHVEDWLEHPFAEFHFSPRAKGSSRIWKATEKNRDNLHQRLRIEQPWFILDFGYPSGTLRSSSFLTHGLEVAITSRPQPRHGGEHNRQPSYIYLEVHPNILSGGITRISDFLELGSQAWEIMKGIYGFVDVETGIPLQDDISRNAIHLFDSTVPKEYHQEFRGWQRIDSQLEKRVWKAFWGNFLSREHLRGIGGTDETQQNVSHHHRSPESQDQAYQFGMDRLSNCDCIQNWQTLSNGGKLVTLSNSPLDWFEAQVQTRRARLQELLDGIALSDQDKGEIAF